MKTSNFKKLAFAIALTFSTLFVLAGTEPNPTGAKSESEKTIRDYFKFPQILIHHQESEKVESRKVEVLFTTDSTGSVNFVLAKIDDEDLKKEIEKQFSKLKLPKLKHEVVYSVILNFRTV